MDKNAKLVEQIVAIVQDEEMYGTASDALDAIKETLRSAGFEYTRSDDDDDDSDYDPDAWIGEV